MNNHVARVFRNFPLVNSPLVNSPTSRVKLGLTKIPGGHLIGANSQGGGGGEIDQEGVFLVSVATYPHSGKEKY